MKIYSVALVMLACILVSSVAQQPPAPAPTPAPTPATTCASTTSKPTPTIGSYHFMSCIVAKFAAYISIGEGKYIELNNGTVNASASRCENATLAVTPRLVVDFGTCAQLEFEIDKQVNGTGYYVKAINGNYVNGNNSVPFANGTALFHTAQSGHYYKCNTEQPIILNKPEHILMLSNFAYEAYRTTAGTDFYQIVEECPLDSSQVSDLVRIGVGICLVALVVIVLVAYFVGRRRWSERSSYESV